MDLAGFLKSEIFRPFATVLVPGVFAVTPYILVAETAVPNIWPFLETYQSLAVFLYLVLVVAAGLILENIGSRIETTFWDIKTKEGDEDFWKSYLALKVSDEYVGQRYLRSILIRMKFELSMGPALVISAAGVIWYYCLSRFTSVAGIFSIAIIMGCLAAYLIYESSSSAKLLGETREIICKAVKQDSK